MSDRKRTQKEWTSEEVQQLCEMYEKGQTSKQIAEELGRTEYSVGKKTSRMGQQGKFKLQKYAPWTGEEDKALKESIEKYGEDNWSYIANEMQSNNTILKRKCVFSKNLKHKFSTIWRNKMEKLQQWKLTLKEKNNMLFFCLWKEKRCIFVLIWIVSNWFNWIRLWKCVWLMGYDCLI